MRSRCCSFCLTSSAHSTRTPNPTSLLVPFTWRWPLRRTTTQCDVWPIGWIELTYSIKTHFLKDRNCDICKKTKITRAPCGKRTGTAILPRAESFGDLITARNNHRHAVVVQDLATQWIQSEEYTFIQNRFHPMTLSSKHDFIQWHFHPKHFHPILTLSSNDTFNQDTFIQQQFHLMNFSSNDIFIQWHFQPITVSSKKKSHVVQSI